MPRTLVLIAAGATTLLVACGSIDHTTPQEIRVGDAQNGLSIQAHVGDIVSVKLDSTYWTFAAASETSILQLQGEATVSPAPVGTCPPGVGCGASTARYKALKPGSAVVTATRVACGEAMRCIGAAGLYQVTIVVG